jgi:hypothetical protein
MEVREQSDQPEEAKCHKGADESDSDTQRCNPQYARGDREVTQFFRAHARRFGSSNRKHRRDGRSCRPGTGLAQQRRQSIDQKRSGSAQFLAVHVGKMVELPLAVRRQTNSNLAVVLARAGTLHQSALCETVNEPYRAVMPHQEKVGEHPHGGGAGLIESLDGQEQLMLLRLKTFGVRGMIAEMEEAADMVAKGGKGLVVAWAEIRFI